MKQIGNPWYVYMLRCADDSLYTGITKDISRRVDEHNNDQAAGANYTRSRRPVTVVYQETCTTRSQAAKREYTIKQMSRQEKQSLIK